MRFWFLIGLVATVALSGCAQTKEYKMKTNPDPSNFTLLEKEGEGIIKGQAFMKTKGGDVKTAAGNKVFLFELNNYHKESMKARYGGDNVRDNVKVVHKKNEDMSSKKIYLTDKADADGRFEFDGLADGTYVVETRVSWKAFMGGAEMQQGGYLCKKVNIDKGERVDIVISPSEEKCY